MHLDDDKQGDTGSDVPSIDTKEPGYHEGLAYAYGKRHESPILSDRAESVANYTCDVKPPDFDNQCLVRMAEDPIAKETIRCSVSGHFIDATVFRDTNILLEILQNAEPQDSKGSWFGFEFFAEGAWHPVVGEIDKFADDKIEALRISDNGKGYMPRDMTTLGGAKREDPESAGRFGSGMKISDRSALGKGVQVTRSSRNWRARPYLESVLTSAGPDSTVSYNVEYVPNMHKGSVVEYRNPTTEMLTAARNIEAIYLPLDRTFRERLVAETDKGLLLKPKGEHGDVMVKGRKYTLTVAPQKPLLFSYDLQNVTIDDQNRHFVDAAKAEVNIVEIWNKVRDPKLFEELVAAATEGRECYELQMRGLENPPACFLEVLKRELGVDRLDLTYLVDTLLDPKDAKVLERRGFKSADNKLARYPFFKETLKNIGVISGAALISAVTKENYGENFSEKPDSFVSTLCKAIVAFRGLEVPEGMEKVIVIVLEDKDGVRTEMSYGDYLRSKPKEVSTVEMVCRLKSGHLRETYTDYGSWRRKEQELSSTDLHERFNAFINASSQVGVDAAVRNGHLEIDPLSSRSYGLYKTRTWSAFPESDFELVIYLNTPTEQKQLEEITKFSLEMDENYKPVAQTEHGDVVKLEGGLIYEQGIRDENAVEKAILSYNITSERDKKEGYKNIHQVLSLVNNIEVARKILKKAKDTDRSEGFAEYGFIPANEAGRATWKKAFEEVFGAETVLDDSGSYKADFKDPITTLADQSAIKKVRLHEKLSETLLACDVRKLSTAVEAKITVEYSPNPIAEALLMVDKVADKAIEVSLPPGISVVEPEIRTAKTIYNKYGQVINGGFGYLDPLLRDKTIYVLDTVLQQSKIGNLLAFVLQKRVEVYRDQMSSDEYIEFKAAVMSICERSVTSMDFLQKIRGVLFRKGKRIGKLVERVVNEIPRQKAEKDQPFVVESKPPRKPLSRFLPSFDKLKDAASKAVRPVAWIVATTACAAGLVVGGKFAVEKMKAAGYFQGSNEGSPDGGGNPGKRGKFNRGWRNESGGRSGVNVERAGLQRGSLSPEAQVAERISFISVPALSWGVFMNESPMNSYNGHGWSTDIDAPDFENPKFGNATRIAHMQKIEKDDKEVFLRPLSGGYIDPDSIELHKADGTEVKIKKLRPGPYGSYEVVLGEDDDVIAVSYHNLMPVKWIETAASLTDEDFRGLPKGAYEYHTKVPDLDLQDIRFSSEVFPEAKNLGEFVTHLQTLTPFERLALIRKVVTKMRYTITERTEKAFSDFHNGKLPEKDFLEFVMNSDRLENPGDGDCDVQNTVFAVIARYAGVPTKLDYVFTDKGIAHAPATVFLPKIGWVIMDSMGERKIIERVGRDRGISDNSNADELDEDKAQKQLLKTLENREKFEDLGCGNLQ